MQLALPLKIGLGRRTRRRQLTVLGRWWAASSCEGCGKAIAWGAVVNTEESAQVADTLELQPGPVSFSRLREPETIAELLRELPTCSPVADRDSLEAACDQLRELKTRLDKAALLSAFATFWPPRLVLAAQGGSLVPFFGAGVSIAAGLPNWDRLLEALGADADLLSDPHAVGDPLTLAEMVAHDVGRDKFQLTLRNKAREASAPSAAHYFLARLCQPAYVTTNYDDLFEKAWEALYKSRPIVVTNDLDVRAIDLHNERCLPGRENVDRLRPILFKVHGDAARDDEQLILTRREYRHHYRSNLLFFRVLKRVLGAGHVLFLGFGHRDPEVGRLVDDVIYDHENHDRTAATSPPSFYSLQFEMRARTPEVFAARGMVALTPPVVIPGPTVKDINRLAFSKALGDLLGALPTTVHADVCLDGMLKKYVDDLEGEIASAQQQLRLALPEVVARRRDPQALGGVLQQLVASLPHFSGQGAYVLRSNGQLAALALPQGLNDKARARRIQELGGLSGRSYFQRAKTFRRPFVSDVDESRMNGNSTIFCCMPIIIDEKVFDGLLFTALQPGAWPTPSRLAAECNVKKVSFVLVDGNGILLVPPNAERTARPGSLILEEEIPAANQGFNYRDMRNLSRRDRLVERIARNVVPVAQDDDVVSLAHDERVYSVVAAIRGTSWKLALSRSIDL